MGTGYTRNDTVNNIADGNIINASDFDGEYDAIENAFNSSTGHTHDGTSGEGGPITVLGPAQDFVASTTDVKPKSDNTLDVGTTLLRFKDIHIAGTANLPTVDIDAGAIDGTTIGGTTPAAGTFTNLTASTNLTLASGSTVTAILDEDNMVSDSDTSLATQQSIKAYVDGQIAGANELSEILANGNITAGTGIDLIDNDKIRFGTGNDLEIFHNGTDSLINDAGDGSLKLQQGGATKLEVTTTGVTVSDDLVVNDDVSLSSDGAIVNLGADSEVTLTHVADTGVLLNVENSSTNSVTDLLKLQVQSSGTPAVGIGTGIEFSTETAAGTLETGGTIESVTTGLTPTAEEFDMVFKTMSAGATAAERLKLNGSGATIGNINVDGNTIISTDTNGNIALTPDGTGEVDITKVDIDSGAIDNVTIGTNSPATELQVDNINVNGNAITSTDTNGNIALTPNGTGEVDISKVDIAGGEIDGTTIGANSAAAGTFTNLTASTNLTLASGTTVTAILDEDTMSSNSDTALATQQSIKAYVDNTAGTGTFAGNVTTTGGNVVIAHNGGVNFDDSTSTYAVTIRKGADPTANVALTLPTSSGALALDGDITALAIALG
jgi:hypothetical protein